MSNETLPEVKLIDPVEALKDQNRDTGSKMKMKSRKMRHQHHMMMHSSAAESSSESSVSSQSSGSESSSESLSSGESLSSNSSESSGGKHHHKKNQSLSSSSSESGSESSGSFSEGSGSESSGNDDRNRDTGNKRHNKRGMKDHGHEDLKAINPELFAHFEKNLSEVNMQTPDLSPGELAHQKAMHKMHAAIQEQVTKKKKMMKMKMMKKGGGKGKMKMKMKGGKKGKMKMKGGPGPGMQGGPGPSMGGPGKQSKSHHEKKKMHKKKKHQAFELVHFISTSGKLEGCTCFPEGQGPSQGSPGVSKVERFKTKKECQNAQKQCANPCQKQGMLIKKLQANIKKREGVGEKSPSLTDAKELLDILQKRFIIGKCPPNTESSSESSSKSSIAPSSPHSSAESSGAASLRLQGKNLGAARNPKKSNELLTKSLSWWWPTPMEIVNKMFQLADLKKGEMVYDLGCGDGRIPVHAANKWGCSGVGIDFDENLVKQANKRAVKFGVTNKVEIRHGDALDTHDLERADVVALYVLDRGMRLMKPILQEKLKKGTRIVSHNYEFKDWKPTKQKVVTDKEGHKHWIYLYMV